MSVTELKSKNRDSQASIRTVLNERGIDPETSEEKEKFEHDYLVAVNGEVDRNLDRRIGPEDHLLVVPIMVGG